MVHPVRQCLYMIHESVQLLRKLIFFKFLLPVGVFATSICSCTILSFGAKPRTTLQWSMHASIDAYGPAL